MLLAFFCVLQYAYMVFNGDANGNDICSDIDFWCSTTDITYPLADKSRNANFGLSRASALIMRYDTTWKHVPTNYDKIPIATKSLQAGVDNYTLETKHAKILRVRIIGKDGVKKTIKAVDRRQLSDDVLNDTGEPTSYDKVGLSLILSPTPDYAATDGVEIEYQPDASVMYYTPSSTDQETGINPNFDRLVSLYASEPYCMIHAPKRLVAVQNMIATLELSLQEYYTSRDIDDEASFEVVKGNSGVNLMT